MTLETDPKTPNENDIDPFEAAFKELSELEAQGKENEFSTTKQIVPVTEQKSDVTSQSVETTAPGTVEVQDQDVSRDKDGGTQAEISTEVPSETEHTETEEKPDPTESLLNKFSEIIDRSNQQVQKQEPEQKAVQTQQEAPVEIYTPEEKEFLQTYAKDWGDVVKGEFLVRKQEYHQLLNYVFQEVSKELKPMLETLQVLSERTHLSDLKSEVSDYSDIREKVIEWADKQPAYLRSAYEHVIRQGTVEEVKDLIERYRKDNGGVAITTKPSVKQTAKTELPEATKQAAAALAPVSSKRSTVTVVTPDANDFDSAFEMFSKLTEQS